MAIDRKQLRKIEKQRRRGWLVYLLYENLPKPLEFASLMFLLDQRNFPLTPRRLSEDLDYLRGLGLLRVFPLGGETELDNLAQAKLLQRYADSDGDLDDGFCALLTTKGVNYQEEHFEEAGITRIN